MSDAYTTTAEFTVSLSVEDEELSTSMYQGGNWMDAEFRLTDGAPYDTVDLNIGANGVYEPPFGKTFGKVTANVPNPSAGAIVVTENGTYDVTDKASVIVRTPVPIELTQAEYDALTTYENTLYGIVEE